VFFTEASSACVTSGLRSSIHTFLWVFPRIWIMIRECWWDGKSIRGCISSSKLPLPLLLSSAFDYHPTWLCCVPVVIDIAFVPSTWRYLDSVLNNCEMPVGVDDAYALVIKPDFIEVFLLGNKFHQMRQLLRRSVWYRGIITHKACPCFSIVVACPVMPCQAMQWPVFYPVYCRCLIRRSLCAADYCTLELVSWPGFTNW
jgi:hypothetical protein